MTNEQMKIMVGFNAYFTSDSVIQVAIGHAKAFKARLFVVTSIVGHSLDESGKLANEEAQNRLDRLKALLEREGIPHEMHLIVREDSAGEDLLNFAKENDIDEIIIGFKKRSTIGEIVFGSNYRQMIGSAPCPIVTVHINQNI
jgi:nucleotide-binding universal stress UspA family protein